MPERVVFLDETSVKTNLTRLRGRSLRGTRLTASAPFGTWGTQTLIAGPGPSDLIAPWVIKGAMDGPAYVARIRDVLIPEIAPGTAVILDNLAIHRNKEAGALLRELLVPAALQPGPQLDRNGSGMPSGQWRADALTLETQSEPEAHWGAIIYRSVRSAQ